MVDNASDDSSLSILKTLTSTGGLPNLQVYALTKEVDENLAAWVGLENALGDFVAVLDPLSDDIDFLPTMLEQAVSGADVVFASNLHRPPQGLVYRTASWAFNALYKRLNGISLSQDAPGYRLLGRHVINFILQFPQPSIPYRHLPATGGFTRVNLSYQSPLPHTRSKKLGESINHGMRLLVSSTQAPMRLVTGLSLFGAVINLLYTFYVLAVGLLKTDIASGWISLSLQQSGMFFLISLVLLVLGEYILNMASLSNEGPRYHVGQEMSSTRITRKEKLNIETSAAPSFPAQT
ncbi:glycosyl transferase [Castellaniella defragrans]|uniref:glycosyl transferase n=1 Tax=Castellaniella defragrans TaxID=75697 RepID=UPI003969D033